MAIAATDNSSQGLIPVADTVVDQPATQAQAHFSERILCLGFRAGLVLSFLCLGVSAVLIFYTTMSIDVGSGQTLVPSDASDLAGRVIMANLAFKNCAIFLGLSLSVLGFSLFLIGAQGVTDGTIKTDRFSVQLLRMSPGVAALMCGTFVIVTSIMHSDSLSFNPGTSDQQQSTAVQPNPSGGTAIAAIMPTSTSESAAPGLGTAQSDQKNSTDDPTGSSNATPLPIQDLSDN